MKPATDRLGTKLKEEKYISGVNKKSETERKGILDRDGEFEEDEKSASKKRRNSRSNGKVRFDTSKKKFKRTNSLTALKPNPKN